MHLYFCAVLKFTFLLKDIETIYLNHVNGTQFRGFSSLISHQLLTHTKYAAQNFFFILYVCAI